LQAEIVLQTINVGLTIEYNSYGYRVGYAGQPVMSVFLLIRQIL